MIFQTITVGISGKSYPIIIGKNLLNKGDLIKSYAGSKHVMLVTNQTVAPLYLDTIKSCLNDLKVDTIILPDGESYKNLSNLEKIIDALLENDHHRDTTLLALGGGVIGDMTGFAASCYQRGVAFIQIPTTLLAQVDASIGGKTAINHRLGKNMMGAFHQPQAVIIDIDTLSTLNNRDYRAGIAEIIKAALITDMKFFEWLEENVTALLEKDEKTLFFAITEACKIKQNIVEQDEKEYGIRALLNLGHTFAHAIEQTLGYGTWHHGEAVALGMIMAADLSMTLNLIDIECFERIKQLIKHYQLPTHLPKMSHYDTVVHAMQGDKKVLNGRLRFILLDAIGHAIIRDDIEEAMLITLIKRYKAP